jgi:hypothetical protein
VEVAAAIRAHCPAIVEPETAHPPVASRAQEEAPGAAIRKATVLEPHFTLELDRAKADPHARHVGGYRALGPEPRDVGRDRKALQQQPVRHDDYDTTTPRQGNDGTKLGPILTVARLATSFPPQSRVQHLWLIHGLDFEGHLKGGGHASMAAQGNVPEWGERTVHESTGLRPFQP